jgi:hypothetical protein
MNRETLKVAVASAWLLALGATSLSGAVQSGNARVSLLAFGLVPVAVMWWFWNPPTPSLSAIIAKARQ